jgi:fumarate reductase subunit C
LASVAPSNRSEGDRNYRRLLKYYKNPVATKMKIIKLSRKIFYCKTMYGQTVMERKTKEDQRPATFKEQVPTKVKI